MKIYQIFILITTILFTVTLFWLNVTRYDDFLDHHKIVATQSIANISNEISRVIAERTLFLKLFTREYGELINQQILSPENEEISQLIDTKLKLHFPDYFSFTIARSDGSPLLDDFNNKIGDLCLEDIRHFAKYKLSNPRIHPNTQAYHFDLMTDLEDSSYIFFISFKADVFSQILRHTHSLDHEEIIVMKLNGKYLIEITSKGSRIKLPRDSYFLSPGELKRVLYQEKIKGTRWSILDMHNENLFRDYQEKLIIQTGIVIIPFILFVIGIFFLVKREERLRYEAEVARDEFLSTVSHELRTPLTAIHGALRLIINGVTGDIPSKSIDLLTIADRNCFRLIHLVNELLDMRKLEIGKMEYHFRKVNIIKLIREVVALNENFASEYGSKIVFNTDLDTVYIHADENRLNQVLTNLISNAVKYGKPSDTITISCTLHKDMVRVSIIDHGKGIPFNEQKLIFEKFSRGSSARSSAISGTGLGLSICKSIITDHGGEINFNSSPEMGTTFYFKLPVPVTGNNIDTDASAD